MRAEQVDRVLRHPLFRDLDRDRLQPALEQLTLRHYAAGEAVAEPSLRRPALHVLLSGRLRLSDVTFGGRRVILDYVEAGGVDGFLAVAGLRGHFSEAMVASDVVSISRTALEEMVASEPRIAVRLLWMASRRLRNREDRVSWLVLRDPSQRIAAQLLALAGAGGDGTDRSVGMTPRLSHEALADLLGLRRETVTLHLGRLRRMGAIQAVDHGFRLNVPVLEAVRDGQEDLITARRR